MYTQHNKFMNKARRLAAAAVIFTFGTAGTALAAESLTLTAGSPGGGYFKAAAALAEYIKKEIPGISTTVIPGGGWANIERIDPKAKKHPIRIAMFERHQLATAQALALLEAYGMGKETIESWGGKIIFTSSGEGTRMIMDGNADAWFTGGSYFPHHKSIELGSKKAFRLLSISKSVAEKVAKRFGQDIMEVPANIYKDNNGKNDAYWSPATIVTFGVRTGLSDDLVYKMASALAKHKEAFWKVHKMHKYYRPEVAWQNVGTAPLHPGAIKFYKENGYMK